MADQVERLVTEWDARFDKFDAKLDKLQRSVFGAAGKIEHRLGAVNDNLGAVFGRGIGNQLEHDLLSLGEKAGISGAALRSMGEIGLVTAGILGTVAAGVEQAIKAMEFGAQLQHSSEQLHETAENLQTLRFAAQEVHIPMDALEGDLKSLDSALGALKLGGRGSERVVQAFANLGIKKEDVANIQHASDLLPVLADRLGQVKDAGEQARIADRLGVRDLIPLLERGSVSLEEMKQQAHDLGLVLSNETVKGLSDANKEMENASDQIKTNLRAAFAGLAVDIADVTSGLATFLTKLRELEARHPKTGAILSAVQDAAQAGLNPFAVLGAKHDADRILRAFAGSPAETPTDALDSSADTQGLHNPGFKPIPTPDKGAADKANQEAAQRLERERAFQRQLKTAEDQELESIRSRTASSADLLDVALTRIETDKDARDVEIGQLQEQYKQSKGLKGLSDSEAALLRAYNERTAAAQEQNLKTEFNRKQEDLAADLQSQLTGFTLDQLKIADQMATTSKERRLIQLQILETERKEARDAKERELKRNLDVSDEQRAQILAGFDADTAAQRRGIEHNTRDPLQEYLDNIPKTADEINEAFKKIDVDGLQTFNNELLLAVQHFESLGQAAKNVLAQILADLIKLEIQRIDAPLVNFLGNLASGGVSGVLGGIGHLFGGGRAVGGPVTPGSFYRVNESGQEYFAPSVPGTIVPQGAMQAATAGRAGVTQVNVFQENHLHAEHGVLTADLIASFDRKIAISRQAAVRDALAGAARGMPGKAVSYQRLGTV